MKCSGACWCGTHRVPLRYNYKSWALAWTMDWNRTRCSNCYTESE
jgi:hypothetical protein